MLDHRAAHEHDMREPVEQAELTDRVGNIDVGAQIGCYLRERNVPRADRDAACCRTSMPRSGWRGTITVRSDGRFRMRRWASMIDLLLARMGGSGDEDLAASPPSADELGGSAGGAGTSSLRLPVIRRSAAKLRKALRIERRLREADVELAEKRRECRFSGRQAETIAPTCGR